MRRLQEGAFRHSAARGNVARRPSLPPLPASLLPPSTSAPRPRPCFPDPLFSRLGAAGRGVPGKRFPCGYLPERKGPRFRLRPARLSQVLLAPRPFPRPSASCPAWSPPVPASRPSPFRDRPPFTSATLRSPRRVGEAEGKGRRNYVAPLRGELPGDPLVRIPPCTRRRGRGFCAAAGRRGGSSREQAAGPAPPPRGCVPTRAQPSPPAQSGDGLRDAVSRSGPEPPKWRETETL